MKKPSSTVQTNAILIGLIVLAGLALWAMLAQRYYALRSGKLTTYMHCLINYAADHDGWYPKGGATPLESLQQLYPQYDKSGLGLAGLSGSERAVAKYLREGRPLDSTVSSWVYFPGFRNDDDPAICMIWERQEGIFLNGDRADGHAVGFVGGGFAQIPSKNWPAFVKHQEELRRSTLSKRATETESSVQENDSNAKQSKP